MQSTYIILFFLIIFILLSERSKKTALLHKIRKTKKLRGKQEMTELIQKYIGKECIIYTCTSSTQIEGVIHCCKDGWIEIEKNGQRDIVNCDYITRIREYPRNKNGKKKSVVLD